MNCYREPDGSLWCRCPACGWLFCAARQPEGDDGTEQPLVGRFTVAQDLHVQHRGNPDCAGHVTIPAGTSIRQPADVLWPRQQALGSELNGRPLPPPGSRLEIEWATPPTPGVGVQLART